MLSLGLGVAASLLAEEPWPFLGCAVMCAYLAMQYENALKQGVNNGPAMDIGGQQTVTSYS
jgi:hypothetical protein